MQIADSMLGCLVIALEYSNWVPRRHRPDYSDAARGVRILVTAIDELDSLNLEQFVAAARRAVRKVPTLERAGLSGALSFMGEKSG